MSNSKEHSFFDLMGRYVHGNIDEQQGEELLHYIEDNPDVLKTLQKNLLIDLYLDRVYTVREKESVSHGWNDTSMRLNDFIDSTNPPKGLLWELLNMDNMSEDNLACISVAVNQDIPPCHSHWEFPQDHDFDPDLNTPITCPDPIHINQKSSWFRFGEKKKANSWLNRRVLLLSGVGFCLAAMIIYGIWSLCLGLFFGNNTWEDTFRSVALVAEVIDVQWPSEDKAFKRGQEIGEGPISFQNGLVKLLYHNGTEVILEGPCEYLVRGEKNSFCSEGRISVSVSPQANGFEISTPFGNIVDRSTEFFVEVTKTECRTTVMKGRVDLVIPELPTIPLSLNQTAMVDIRHKVRSITSESRRFISREQMESRTRDYTTKLETRNDLYREKWDTLPDLVARFHFGDSNTPTVQNQSVSGHKLCSQLILSDCKSGEGPLWGTRSILFDRDNSCGRFNIPGEYQSMTFIVLLRINRLTNQGNVICANNNFFNRPGSILWQISREGKLQFFISDEKKNNSFRVESSVVLPRSHWGTWLKLAVVVDSKNKTITQYCDGKSVSREKWTGLQKLQWENMMLGNMTDGKVGKNNRNLNGAIEDVLLFSRALSAEEIAAW